MWSLIKLVVGTAMAGALAYVVFFVDLGGQTLASHAADIWRAPVVQQKVERLRSSVQDEIHERLRPPAGSAEAAGRGEVTEADRRALEALLKQATADRGGSPAAQ